VASVTSRNRHDPLPPDGPGRVVPPSPSTIDLHTHTTRSDGIVPPAELVAAIAATGVTLLALTDHDTLAGYREVVEARAVPPGLTLVPGVEINAIVTRDLGLWEGELHILGFGMDAADETLEAALADQRGQRRQRFERTVGRLRDIGSPIDDQLADLSDSTEDALGRPTVARALIAAGHADSVEDAFNRFLSWGQPAYVARTGLDPIGAIRVIRAAGGLPVLAHFAEAPSRVEVVRELAEAGLAGLEVYYRSFDAATVFAVGEVAAALGLLATGGTDYHGDASPYAEAHSALWVPPEVRAALLGALGDPGAVAAAD